MCYPFDATGLPDLLPVPAFSLATRRAGVDYPHIVVIGSLSTFLSFG
jgi:hypothetical protein